jgi:hypothetical protein
VPRIEIELTSSRPDGTWTWRAAGARQPKGTLDAALLFPGAKVGDVVRADCEIDLDGTRVTALFPPRAKRPGPDRLAILGSGRQDLPVTQDGGPPVERDRGRREGARRPAGERRDRPDRERPDRERPDRERKVPRPRPEGSRDRTAAERPRDRPPRERAQRERGPRERADQPRRPRDEAPAPAPPRPRPKRLQPGRKHREAVLESLPPEQRPVAEQVLRGGIPSVRQAVEEQNARARAEGKPEVHAHALVALAETLLPRLRAAEWRDRAEAAAGDADQISLRDLRAVVAGSDAAGRDEESRALAASLREALDRRLAAEQEAWLGEIRQCLGNGRVVRALRVSGRPPDAGVRFPAELGDELSRAAGEAMTPETTAERWVALLDAVVSSPVRRTVAPRGLPAERGQDLERALRLAAPRVPAIGALLGGPRPPGPRRPRPPRPDPSRAAAGPSTPSRPAPSGDDGDDPVLVKELG